MKISTGDLYCLRHTHLAAQRANLEAQQAEQAFREVLLDMEYQYGLLGTNASIDVHTGEISASPPNGSKPPSNSSGQTQEHHVGEPETNETR